MQLWPAPPFNLQLYDTYHLRVGLTLVPHDTEAHLRLNHPALFAQKRHLSFGCSFLKASGVQSLCW